MAKTLADTFLYGKQPDYNRKIVQFITQANRINTKSAEFSDILFDVKRRRVSDSLAKVITSNNVVIGTMDASLPKAFRTFVAKDAKDGNRAKIFIDGSEFLRLNAGTYDCINMDWLISYVIAGTTNYIYKLIPQKLLLDSSVITDGCDCFVRLFSYIVDRIYKITSVPIIKKRIDYTIALYYLINLLEKAYKTENAFRALRSIAARISTIDDRDARIVDMEVQPGDFANIDSFIKALGRIYSLKDFKIDVFISMWINAFGTGTPFAVEYFPALSMMLTNSYIGGYIDNQNMIEKLCGNSLVAFSKTILRIGDSVS